MFERKTLFYATCVPFFVFFFVFDRVIYPNRRAVQPELSTMRSLFGLATASSDIVDDGAVVGDGAFDIIAKLLSHWTSSLYYVIAEVYSSVSVGILFWQYANDVVSIDQARRFYPLFAQMSGLAPIVAGQYVVRYASRSRDFETSLGRVTNMITFSGIMICAFYAFSNSYIERTESRRTMDGTATGGKETDVATESNGMHGRGKGGGRREEKTRKKKSKMTMIESARFLASSEYLRLIATLVVGYGENIIHSMNDARRRHRLSWNDIGCFAVCDVVRS